MERLRDGAHTAVMESGHIVVAGSNDHLETVLRQLNKSQEYAVKEGIAAARQGAAGGGGSGATVKDEVFLGYFWDENLRFSIQNSVSGVQGSGFRF